MASFEKQITKKRSKFNPDVGLGASPASKVTYIMPTGDVRKVPGQNFLVMSYACPDGITRVRSPKGMVQKFSGTFATQTEANSHAEAIRNEDPRFDVFVVDLYKWGQVPLPEEERPFISSQYTDDMLTRIVSGLQRSMAQGKREMEERKARDRSKAEAAMQKVKGKDYKMPEKSAVLERHEAQLRKEREEEIKKAKEESRASRLSYSEDVIMNAVMQFCIDRSGAVIEPSTGSDFMKYLVEKVITSEAEMRRAREREIGRQDENPANFPSADELKKPPEEPK